MALPARRIFNALTHAYGRIGRLASNGAAPPPLFVNCVVTFDCNMACPFCFARTGRSQLRGSPLAAAQWAQIIRQIPAYALLGFSGGEAFCHPQFRDIFAAAGERHRFVLVSNGRAIDETVAAELAALGAESLRRKGLVQVGISINEPLADEQACRAALAEKLHVFGRLARHRLSRGRRFPRLEMKVVIRDETAPHLAVFAGALESPDVDAVTFQMLSNQRFAYYLGTDPADRPAVDALRDYRNTPPEPLAFAALDGLRESFARLASLPKAARRRINFLPDLPPEKYVAYYEGRMNLADFRCGNPWVHLLIDPAGVARQCFNPDGADLTATPLRAAWNAPSFREFRRDLRARGSFPCCAGCCFLTPK
jgi:hypothetical protein